MRSAHVCGIEELCIPKSSTAKGEIVENKQSLSSPAGERENIMGTMDINPLLGNSRTLTAVDVRIRIEK